MEVGKLKKLNGYMASRKAQPMHQQPRYGMRKLSVGLASCVLGFILYASPTVVQAAEADTVDPVVASEENQTTEEQGANENDLLESPNLTNDSNEDTASNEGLVPDLEIEERTKADSEVEDSDIQSKLASKKEALATKSLDTPNGEDLRSEKLSITSAVPPVPVADSALNIAEADKDNIGEFYYNLKFEYYDDEGDVYKLDESSKSIRFYGTEDQKFYINYWLSIEESNGWEIANNPVLDYKGQKYSAKDYKEGLNYIPGQTLELEYLFRKKVESGTINYYQVFQDIKEGKVFKKEKKLISSTKNYVGGPSAEFTFVSIERLPLDADGTDTKKVKYSPEYTILDGKKDHSSNVSRTVSYIPGIQEYTQVYQRVIKHGVIEETHLYYDVGYGDVIQGGGPIEGRTVKGYKTDTYTTNPLEKEGYKLKKIVSMRELDGSELSSPFNPAYTLEFNSDRTEVKTNFVEGETLRLVYIYYKPKPGKFTERHVYQVVDEDGIVLNDRTEEISETYEGQPGETYTTRKNNTKENEGYKFVEAVDPLKWYPDRPVEFDPNGKEKTGQFYANTFYEVDYIYQKQIITKGTFQNIHIYQDIDEDGNIYKETPVYGVIQRGKDPRYSTSAFTDRYRSVEDSDGYELKEITGSEGAVFNKDGSMARGEYIAGKDLKVTYIYQKPVITKGTSEEHHIYQIFDEDGVFISETREKEISEGKDGQAYTPQPRMKEGYELVNRIDESGRILDIDGREFETHYRAKYRYLHTYVYKKTVITKGSFLEEHIYQEVDEDGNVLSQQIETKKTIGKEKTNYVARPLLKEGYRVVNVEAADEAVAEAQGNELHGQYIAGTTQNVTFTYQKSVVTKGTLHETHIYQEIDEEGNVLSQQIETKETIGKEKTNYVARPLLKEGYRVVNVEAADEAVAEAQGNELHGQYIAGTTQNVTFTYQKVVPTVGYMKEIHIYQEVDADGNVLSESYYTHVFSGKSDMIYVNSRIDKEGYELVDVRGSNGVKYSLVGDMGIDRYVGGRYQEVTYIYQKVKAADSQSAKPLLPASPDKSEYEVVEDSPKVVEETSVEVQKAQFVPTLPQTGEADTKALVGLSALSVMTGLGMLASGRKKKED